MWVGFGFAALSSTRWHLIELWMNGFSIDFFFLFFFFYSTAFCVPANLNFGCKRFLFLCEMNFCGSINVNVCTRRHTGEHRTQTKTNKHTDTYKDKYAKHKHKAQYLQPMST